MKNTIYCSWCQDFSLPIPHFNNYSTSPLTNSREGLTTQLFLPLLSYFIIGKINLKIANGVILVDGGWFHLIQDCLFVKGNEFQVRVILCLAEKADTFPDKNGCPQRDKERRRPCNGIHHREVSRTVSHIKREKIGSHKNTRDKWPEKPACGYRNEEAG